MFYIKCVFNLLFWVSGVSLPCGNWSFPVWENFLVVFPPIYFLSSFFQKLLSISLLSDFLDWVSSFLCVSFSPIFCFYLFYTTFLDISSSLFSDNTICFLFYWVFLVSKHSYCLFHEWLSWLFFLGNINSHYFEVLFCFLLYFKFF